MVGSKNSVTRNARNTLARSDEYVSTCRLQCVKCPRIAAGIRAQAYMWFLSVRVCVCVLGRPKRSLQARQYKQYTNGLLVNKM